MQRIHCVCQDCRGLTRPFEGLCSVAKKVPTETMESGTKIDLVSGDESVAAGLLEIAARILNRHSKVSSD